MEQLEQFQYEKLNYATYQKKLQELLKNEQLLSMGFKKEQLVQTKYGYSLDMLTIGYGEKELFLVGGTHGSEIIGVDFILNFIKELPNLGEFDPSLLKLVIIPVQNPEGFDISTNTLKTISPTQFEEKSYEYYLRYRTDSLILLALKELNELFKQLKYNTQPVTPNYFLLELKEFIHNNRSWLNLANDRAIPSIQIFNNLIDNINSVADYQELQIKILSICNQTLEKLKKENIHDEFLNLFIHTLVEQFKKEDFWDEHLVTYQKRLYQEMFENVSFQGLYNTALVSDLNKMYDFYDHPKGSQVGHDATGVGINLNANNQLNPGLVAISEGYTVYGLGVKSNIKNYYPGPIGVPTLDAENFHYSIENQCLENLIKTSCAKGSYLATLLYHSSGGMIYYKPYQFLMEEKKYQEIYNYNEELATIYSNDTGYKLLTESNFTGYGDYLRRTYPGVLLIELSKMGGNPIGPYGDKNNIYNVFHDNCMALNSLFQYFNEKEKNKSRKK